MLIPKKLENIKYEVTDSDNNKATLEVPVTVLKKIVMKIEKYMVI